MQDAGHIGIFRAPWLDLLSRSWSGLSFCMWVLPGLVRCSVGTLLLWVLGPKQQPRMPAERECLVVPHWKHNGVYPECHWIGLQEKLHRKSRIFMYIFHGQNHGFRLSFSHQSHEIVQMSNMFSRHRTRPRPMNPAISKCRNESDVDVDMLTEMLASRNTCWLVVWNMNFMFPYIENFIIPTDSYFFRGVGIPATSEACWSDGKRVTFE
jgi:hypothetical protein